jgi:acyl-CoA synthetase (NDP forming)
MVDIASGFSLFGDRLPKGKRVGIVTGSGGGGGWMADTCALAGLEVPELDPQTRARIDKDLPGYATSQNPIDGTAGAIRVIGYGNLLSMVGESSAVDAVIGITSARRASTYETERESLTQLARETEKPILIWSYTQPHPTSVEILSQIGLPVFTNIQSCARTMAEMAEYRTFREGFLRMPEIRTRTDTAKRRVREGLGTSHSTLCEYQVRPLLAAYGIGEGDIHLAQSPQQAVEAAMALGGAVVLKVQSPDIMHKSEADAVALNLNTADDVRSAYQRVLSGARAYCPEADIHGVLVQPMAPEGHELILGVSQDEKFGPMLMVGLGGIYVEVLKDVVFSPVPFGHGEARQLLDRLKGAPLLRGVRGDAPSDLEALVEVMVNLSTLAADFAGEIMEIDLNPVLVHPRGHGISIADALMIKSTGQ